MNRFSQARSGYKLPGIERPFHSDFVSWYTNGIIASSPRRLRLREFRKVRWSRKGFRRLRRSLPFRLEPF